MTENHENGLFSDSRRSLVKKGALATTAVALGTGVTAGTGAAQQDEEFVLFAEDYHPGVDYEVASVLQTSVKDEVMQNAEIEDEFDNPDDWDGYLINYDLGGSSGLMAVIFSEGADLDAGDTETMSESGSFRNSELGLIETS